LNYGVKPIPFVTKNTINNPANGISPDGKIVVGFSTLPPNYGEAYIAFNGKSKGLPFAPGMPHQADARAVSNHKAVAGENGITQAYDLDRRAPALGALWLRPASTNSSPMLIQTGLGDPVSCKVYDTSADGKFVVGSGASPQALVDYPDPGEAHEAVLFKRNLGNNTLVRTWLGVPAGSTRHFSRALGIGSDSANPKGLTIAGDCGGNWLTDDVQYRRPATWQVKAGVVNSVQLPLLKSSWSVPVDTEFGSASAVSKKGDLIGGFCGTLDFQSTAVLWQWGPEPRSVREILMDAGVPNLENLTLWSVVAISEDGRIVSGNGWDDANYFGWVARLPPRPSSRFDWKKVPRKLPNLRVNPLYRLSLGHSRRRKVKVKSRTPRKARANG
jgi:uncharacterized membrane protein